VRGEASGGGSPQEETFKCVFLEIKGIPYMKEVTEFREIPRNFTELYDTEFGGIPPEF
jgi:hypothetical protein